MPFAPREACVVTRRHRIGAKPVCMIQKCLELDFAVANHIRVWRAPGAVFVQKLRKHPFAIFSDKIDRFQLDADDVAGRGGVDQILARSAIFVGVIVIPVLHENADHFMARALEKPRRDGGVDSSGHTDDNALLGCHGMAEKKEPGVIRPLALRCDKKRGLLAFGALFL